MGLFSRKKPNKYVAFLSYSRADGESASTLHRRLERFVVPSRLRARTDGFRRLFPIFRDEDEFAASKDLGSAIRAALDRSKAMIVLCSTHSAQSRWVDEEVSHFTSTQPDGSLVCVLLGSRDAEVHSLMPPTLERLCDAGREPLAIDYRGGRLGDRSNLLRIVAALLNVGYDDLVRRDRRRRIGRALLMTASSIPLVFGSAAVSGYGMSLWYQGGPAPALIEDYAAVATIACQEVLRVGDAVRAISENAQPQDEELIRSLRVSASLIFDICQRYEVHGLARPSWHIYSPN